MRTTEGPRRQRRADVLGEICRQWLDRADRPAVAGERPHVTVTVGLEVLQGSTIGTCELDHNGPVPSETTRRIACDASVPRVVLSARSEPLDVGRRAQVVPPAIRRAVVARDRRCRFPGCDRPHTWCDAHLGLNRSLQHRPQDERSAQGMVHERGGFRLHLEDDRPVFRRPDGTCWRTGHRRDD